jgi:hypothetical protein
MPRGGKQLASCQNSFRQSRNEGTQMTELKYNEVLSCPAAAAPAVLSESEVELIRPRHTHTRTHTAAL